jgi:DNA invertase Pin-like site-specific DNA recombinase
MQNNCQVYRVSTREQNLDMQIDALKKYGCEKIYQEKASGTKAKREELDKLLEQLRSGDILVVYSLDRLGRTVLQLINLITVFKEKGIHFKSITEGAFDTTSPMGEAIFQIIAVLKSVEVNVLKERTRSGLDAARARGRLGGRPVGSYNKVKAAAAATLYQKETSIRKICDTLKISRSTLYEYLRKEEVEYIGFKKSEINKEP